MYAIKLAQVHFPKNNLILRMKTKPITTGAHATVHIHNCIWTAFVNIFAYLFT